MVACALLSAMEKFEGVGCAASIRFAVFIAAGSEQTSTLIVLLLLLFRGGRRRRLAFLCILEYLPLGSSRVACGQRDGGGCGGGFILCWSWLRNCLGGGRCGDVE